MLEIKTTHIKNRYHARLLRNGKVIDEMACQYQDDIGWICREMLRWYDKCGGMDDFEFAEAARKRQNNSPKPIGKVWYQNALDEEKQRRK